MTARDRCHWCDASLATLEDHAAWLEAGEPDDYRPDLCWLAEQWRFNPWRGTTQSDPFPWERQPLRRAARRWP